jgi:hypothetical protein
MAIREEMDTAREMLDFMEKACDVMWECQV